MKLRRITLRCISKNIYFDLPNGAHITLSPNVPAMVRVYKSSEKNSPLIAMYCGVMAMHDDSITPEVLNAPDSEVQERAETASKYKFQRRFP